MGAVNGGLGITWAARGRALPGQAESGDAWCLRPDGERDWVLVVDGLGHGRDAAAASRAATQAFLSGECPRDLSEAMQRCQAALKRTRGAALCLACANRRAATLDWCGVGNVEGLVLSAAGPRRMLTANGIVGTRLPRFRVAQIPLEEGDWIAIVTDGMDRAFSAHLTPLLDAPAQAQRLLDTFALERDDALVVLGRVHD